jgi:hypothetical protein
MNLASYLLLIVGWNVEPTYYYPNDSRFAFFTFLLLTN